MWSNLNSRDIPYRTFIPYFRVAKIRSLTKIDVLEILCTSRVGLVVSMASSHADDPGLIPGLDFSFDKADLVLSLVVKISVIS